MQGVFFVNGGIQGRAIHLAGGGVNDAGCAQIVGRLQHIQRAHDIGVDHMVGVNVGVGDANERGEVKDNFLPFHGLAHGRMVGQFAEVKANLRP